MVAPIMTDLRIGVLPISTGTRLILHPAAQRSFDKDQRLVMTERRFPPPWSVEDIGTAFIVTDGAGQKVPEPFVPAIRWFNTSASTEPRTHDAR